MSNSCCEIALKFKFFKLRDCDSQRRSNFFQPRVERPFRRARELLEEIAAEWIAHLTNGPVWFAHKLRN